MSRGNALSSDKELARRRAVAEGLTVTEAAVRLQESTGTLLNWALRRGLKFRSDNCRREHVPAIAAVERPESAAAQDACPVACCNLWRAVLLEEFRTALTVGTGTGEHGQFTAPERDAARSWFGSRDFHMVCALAGLDGATVLSAYQRQLVESDRQLEARARCLLNGGTFRAWGPGYYEKRHA